MRFDQLEQMTGGKLLTVNRAEQKFAGVSIDSRTVGNGELFFAIDGERSDGHQFVDEAVLAGASGVVVRDGFFADKLLPEKAAVVEVADTHVAMMHLTKKYLATLAIDRIGITGSNGKTTTKEYTYRLLRAVRDNVYRTPGNFNNLFGVPLTLFAMPVETKVAVFELGISTPGEMLRLASLVRPHLLAITNVGPTHLEFLGSVEAVAIEKLLAMKSAVPGASLIINADDDLLVAETRRAGYEYVTFGVKAEADFKPDAVALSDDGTMLVTIEGHRFVLPLFGEYQVSNLMAAYAIVSTLGYRFDKVATEQISLTTDGMRGETIQAAGITFIADCYNANPESVKAGLASFASAAVTGRRIVILGDMLELGDDAEEYHRAVGRTLVDYSFDLVVAIGPLAVQTIEAAKGAGLTDAQLIRYDDVQAAVESLSTILCKGDTVYLKGSRGIGLERILDSFVSREDRN